MAVWARCMGKDAPTVNTPDMACDATPCAQLYAEVDEAADWYGGCENDNFDSTKPDLTSRNGVCAFINGAGGFVSEWYYGASMQHKSGRYVYADGELISLLVSFASSVSGLTLL